MKIIENAECTGRERTRERERERETKSEMK
jgi:hypothetical protein